AKPGSAAAYLSSENLGSLDEDLGVQVLLFLSPCDALLAARLGRSSCLARAAGREALWEQLSSRSWGSGATAAGLLGPNGEPCGRSFRRHFALWRKAMDELGLAADAEVPLRWVATWRRLRKWLSKHAPEVDATLRGPADAVALTALQDFVGGGPVAPVVAGLWRICDGQDAPLEQGLADELRMPVLCSDDVSWWRGIFGGYAVYDYEISTVLLPLQ
ncbi:unnamed protein product, partial [Polarella glacialis]